MEPEDYNKPKKKKKETRYYDIGVAAGDQGTSDNVPKSESTANQGPSTGAYG